MALQVSPLHAWFVWDLLLRTFSYLCFVYILKLQ